MIALAGTSSFIIFISWLLRVGRHWRHWLVTLCRVGHGSDVYGFLLAILDRPKRTMQRRAFGRLDVNATFKKGDLLLGLLKAIL